MDSILQVTVSHAPTVYFSPQACIDLADFAEAAKIFAVNSKSSSLILGQQSPKRVSQDHWHKFRASIGTVADVDDPYSQDGYADAARMTDRRRPQLVRTRCWTRFERCVTLIENFWNGIPQGNRCYDYGWCKSHLDLWHRLTEIEQQCERRDLYIGPINVSTPSPLDDGSELVANYKYLLMLCGIAGDAMRRHAPGYVVPTCESFVP